MKSLTLWRLLSTTIVLSIPLLVLSADRYEYRPIHPKGSSKSGVKSTPPRDWDMVYQVLNRVAPSNIRSGIRRSIQNISGVEVIGSLLYGLSMAAGLALGVSVADSNVLNAIVKRVDHRFLSRRTNADKNLFSTKLSDPVLQKYVAPSKDGKDHYHHVVHYHVPYPLSIGALETARQNYPQISWYNTHSSTIPGKVVLSGYLSPIYRSPDAIQETASSSIVSNLSGPLGNQEHHLRRNDFHIYSDSNYFKHVNPKHQRPPHSSPTHKESRVTLTTASPPLPPPQKVPSFEELFFGEHHRYTNPMIDSIHPNLQDSYQHQSSSPTLTNNENGVGLHEGDSFPSSDIHSLHRLEAAHNSGHQEALISNHNVTQSA